MQRISVLFGVSLAAFAIAGGTIAVSGAFAAQRIPTGLPPSAALLLRFDANHDGVITKDEMDAGLKTDFAAADTNGDGCLNPQEVRAENERRLLRDGQEASPLVDWNLDGCVDMREFSNTAHSYFDLADRTKDGRVTALELRGPSMPIAPRGSGSKSTTTIGGGSDGTTPSTSAATQQEKARQSQSTLGY